jgi:hypothetical protein
MDAGEARRLRAPELRPRDGLVPDPAAHHGGDDAGAAATAPTRHANALGHAHGYRDTHQHPDANRVADANGLGHADGDSHIHANSHRDGHPHTDADGLANAQPDAHTDGHTLGHANQNGHHRAPAADQDAASHGDAGRRA